MTAKKVVTTKELRVVIPKNETLDKLIDALEGNRELVIFFLTWLECGRNAQKAYKKLNPEVTDGSAAVMGSRLLKKVNISIILDSMGLGVEKYLGIMAEGLEATIEERVAVEKTVGKGKKKKTVTEYIKVLKPDCSIRNHHHKKLGELHKLEGQIPPIAFQVNQNNQNIAALPDQDIDGLLSR